MTGCVSKEKSVILYAPTGQMQKREVYFRHKDEKYNSEIKNSTGKNLL